MGFGGGSRVHFNYAGIRIHHLKAKNERDFVGKKRNVSTEDSGKKTNSIHDQVPRESWANAFCRILEVQGL